MMNQGDTVGNTKGLVVIVIQYGEVLRCGMVTSSFGTVAPATASLLSGKALAGSLGAAQAKRSLFKVVCKEKEKQVMQNGFSSVHLLHNIIIVILWYCFMKLMDAK